MTFDAETINREFAALPPEDYFRLGEAMLAYRRDEDRGTIVKNYGEGLIMVKDTAHGQGRCLFFTVRVERGEEILTALLVYKKETQETPRRVLDTARRRMRDTPWATLHSRALVGSDRVFDAGKRVSQNGKHGVQCVSAADREEYAPHLLDEAPRCEKAFRGVVRHGGRCDVEHACRRSGGLCQG